MIERKPSPEPGFVVVTFRLAGAAWAERVNLVGDFSNWDTRATEMERDPDGLSWSVSLTLQQGRAYEFRYLVDGTEWQNDWYADEFVPNAFGSENSVIIA